MLGSYAVSGNLGSRSLISTDCMVILYCTSLLSFTDSLPCDHLHLLRPSLRSFPLPLHAGNVWVSLQDGGTGYWCLGGNQEDVQDSCQLQDNSNTPSDRPWEHGEGKYSRTKPKWSDWSKQGIVTLNILHRGWGLKVSKDQGLIIGYRLNWYW